MLNIGVAGGPVPMMRDFVRTGHFDAVLTHNRFTLLDQSAEVWIDEAAAAGVGVINAAPFGGGLLARAPGATSRYAYREASVSQLRAVRAMNDICLAFGFTLRAATLHFSVRDTRIASTLVGASSSSRIDDLLVDLGAVPPDGLWPALHEVISTMGQYTLGSPEPSIRPCARHLADGDQTAAMASISTRMPRSEQAIVVRAGKGSEKWRR